jgi:hypothetical protein
MAIHPSQTSSSIDAKTKTQRIVGSVCHRVLQTFFNQFCRHIRAREGLKQGWQDPPSSEVQNSYFNFSPQPFDLFN